MTGEAAGVNATAPSVVTTLLRVLIAVCNFVVLWYVCITEANKAITLVAVTFATSAAAVAFFGSFKSGDCCSCCYYGGSCFVLFLLWFLR